MRAHRTSLQRLIYAYALRCPRCPHTERRLHRTLDSTLQFVFSRTSRCIRCGTQQVQRTARQDHIESMSGNIVSVVLGWTGAPLNKCSACRLQYRDWRPPHPVRSER